MVVSVSDNTRPYLSLDGSFSGSQRSSDSVSLPDARDLKREAISKVRNYFQETLKLNGRTAKLEILDDLSLEIRPRSVLNPVSLFKTYISPAEMQETIDLINQDFKKHRLGSVTFTYDPDHNNYRIYLEEMTSRQVQSDLHGTGDIADN